jgi:hypothetical protein
MYNRRYSGYFDYTYSSSSHFKVESFIIHEQSIGFSLSETDANVNVGWKVSGTAAQQGTDYVASGVKLVNRSVSTKERTIRFSILHEAIGETVEVRGTISGPDIETGSFEGTLEAIK